MAKGREQNAPREYRQFVQDVEQAELEAEASAVLLWRLHMKTDYRAIRDFMERRYPTRLARKEHVVHEGGVPVADPAANTLLGRLADDPVALTKYNDFLSALSASAGAQSGWPRPPSQ